MEEINKRVDSEITESDLNLENKEESEKNKNEEKKGGILLEKISGKNKKKIKKIEEHQNQNISENDISYISQALIGDFMPSVLMLEQNLININEIINEKTGQTLLHYACFFSYHNVCRCYIELYKADYNIKDKEGNTPLHLLSKSSIKDIMLYSYFVNLNNIDLDEENNLGITPLAYCIIHQFNIAFMFLISKKVNLNHKDKFGNDYLYYALKNDNIFAFNFLINHSDCNLNNNYYYENHTLVDALISNRKCRISNHIINYFINQVNIESIINCTKNIYDFPYYNQFNYEAWNTILFFKTGNFKLFLNLLFANYIKYFQRKNARNNRNNVNLYFNSEQMKIKNKIDVNNIQFNDDITYNFKIENLCLFIEKLCFINLKSYMKYFVLIFDILSFIIMEIFFWRTEVSFIKHIFGILIFIILLLNLFFLERTKLNNENFIEQKYLLSDLENNVFKYYINCKTQTDTKNIPTDDTEICEICLNKKLRTTQHCLICDKCVKNFYFHSQIYNICIHRNNSLYYINTIWPLIIIYLFIAFSYNLFYTFIFLFLAIYFFGKILPIIISIGTDTTYFNNYNYQYLVCDDEVIYRKSSGNYFPLPKMFRVGFIEFIKNFFRKSKKN